jgi:RecB family exonuclease
VTEASLPLARELLETAVAEGRAELEADLPATTAASTVLGLEADLRRYLLHAATTGETPYDPTLFEQRFGFDDAEAEEPSLPPLVVGAGDEAVRIRGAIDRVDIGPDGKAMVRDYKSGRAGDRMAVASWEKRGTLQVAVYMLAVRDLLGLVPVGGLYQPLRASRPGDLRARGVVEDRPEVEPLVGGAFVRSDVISAEELGEALRSAEERIVTLARDLRAGRLTPQPETCGFFNRCAHPGICRSGA